jgi:hypothetical protein
MFANLGTRGRLRSGCLRLEMATSLVVPLHGHKVATLTRLAPANHQFERLAARLLSVQRHKVARSRGLAPRSFGLTDRRLTLVELRIKWSGISVPPRVSPGPRPDGFLSSSCPMADGGGLSPQTSYEEVLPVFKTGHRYAVLHHPFKVVLPAGIAPAASSSAN